MLSFDIWQLLLFISVFAANSTVCLSHSDQLHTMRFGAKEDWWIREEKIVVDFWRKRK